MDKETKEYRKGDKQAIAYEFIRDAIMKNRFEANAPLTEKELSGMLDDMSRTPIRDALMRLEHEGLVERIPGKGLFVTQASIADLLEITEMRLPLECTAVRLFIERADEDMRADLHETLADHIKNHEQGDNLEAVARDNGFHYIIASGSMNNRLYNCIHKLIEESSRGAYMTHRDSERIETSIDQHQKIMDAIDANDADRAAELVSVHLTSWIDYVKEMQIKNYYWFNR